MRLVVVLFVSLMLSAGSHLLWAALESPWEYPYTTGQALYHFDNADDNKSPNAISLKNTAFLEGNVVIDPTNKIHGAGALKFSGGRVAIERFPWTANLIRTLEFFVRIDNYPEQDQEASIIRMVGDKGQLVCSFILLANGKLRLSYAYADHLQRKFSEKGTMNLPVQTLKKNQWQHCAIQYFRYNGWMMMRLVIDGVIIEEEYAGFIKKQIVNFFIGNSEQMDAPFQGWIDELRVSSSFGFLPPEPKDKFVDPKKERDFFSNPTYFPLKKDILFYASFDETPGGGKDADETLKTDIMAAGTSCRWRDKTIKPRYAPGVRGRALKLGANFDFPAAGNIREESGTLSFWLFYKGDMRQVGTLFKVFSNKGVFQLSGTNGLYIHDSSQMNGKFYADYRISGGGWWKLGITLRKNRWNNIVMTWQGEWCYLYFNGEKKEALSFLAMNGIKAAIAKSSRVEIGDFYVKDKYTGLPKGYIDEYMIFDRALSQDEIVNLYRWAKGEKPLPVKNRYSQFDCYPSFRRIVIRVDHIAAGIKSGKRLQAKLISPDGKLICKTVKSREIDGITELVLNFPIMSAGDYTVSVNQKRDDSETVVSDSFIYHHADHKFLKKQVGLDNKVLPPWISITVDKNKVRLSGREFVLKADALPEAITVQNSPLLAGLMVFELERKNGEIITLSGERGGLKKESLTPEKVEFTGLLISEELKVSIHNETEYDGVSKITLKLLPGTSNLPVKRLTVVIPLTVDAAKYINARGAGIFGQHLINALPLKKGRVFGSHIMPETMHKTDMLELLAQYDEWNDLRQQGVALPKKYKYFTTHTSHVSSGSFLPYIWIGSPEMGLCWFADTDQGWVRGTMQTPAVEVRRLDEGGIVELRINLIASEIVINKERTIVFGILPTPVKPLEPEWRKRYWKEPTILGFKYSWLSGRIYKGKGCPGAYYGEPFPRDWKRAKWFSKIAKEKSFIQVPYMEFTNIKDYDIPKYMVGEWRVQPFGWRWQGGLFAGKGYADWFCYWFDKYVRAIGLDGVYFDNIRISASMNEYSHGAWRDDDGVLQASYGLWALRDMFRRIRTVLIDAGVKKPWIQYHMTHSNIIPAMLYGDVLFDGEFGVITPGGGNDFMDIWSLDRITAIDSPHTWGIPTRFMASTIRGNWIHSLNPKSLELPNNVMRPLRTGAAVLLLVDCIFEHWMLDVTIYRDMKEWGVDLSDCRFVGHWKNKFWTEDKNIKAAAYQRPNKVLLVITNFSHEKKDTTISFSPNTFFDFSINEASVSGAETKRIANGKQWKFIPAYDDLHSTLKQAGTDWILNVGPIPPRDFRLIRIECKK